jgi:hypothetical protein
MDDNRLKHIARDLCIRTILEEDPSIISSAAFDKRLSAAEVSEVSRMIANIGSRLSFAGGCL